MKYIIQPFLNNYGGAERKTYILAKECKANGIDFKLITWRFNKKIYREYKIKKNIKIINAPNLSFWILKTIIYIISKKRKKQIFAMNYPANIIAGILTFISFGNIKSIWMCNEVSSALNNKRRNIFKKITFTFGEYLSIFFINTIFVNSKTTYNTLRKEYSIKAKKIIYSGIDPKYYENILGSLTKKKNIKKDINFLYLGRIEKHKGIDLILEIALKNKDKNFLIVGQGNYLEEFRKKTSDIENISFYGRCDDKQKIELILRSELFLFTPPNEPLGVVVMESIYLGTKVLAFNKGGPSEIIRNGIDGYLASTKEEYIKIACDYKFIIQKNDLSKIYIDEHFNEKKMVEAMIEGWHI